MSEIGSQKDAITAASVNHDTFVKIRILDSIHHGSKRNYQEGEWYRWRTEISVGNGV